MDTKILVHISYTEGNGKRIGIKPNTCLTRPKVVLAARSESSGK